MTLDRRSLLLAAAAAPFASCSSRSEAGRWVGDWVGADAARGHRLRDLDARALPAPAVQRRAGVVVVGAGIAGLGAARAAMQAGIDDVHVLDLESSPGGNSRGHVMAGMRCPLGAHYLPVPNEIATEVVELLEGLGLRRVVHGEAVYDERTLCHSPQERLFIDGHWHDGLLPPVEALPAAERDAARAEYQRFADVVTAAGRHDSYAIPTARATWSADHAALDAIPFAAWLDSQRFSSPALRWYLDYCCRDDYGAGAAQVSAWAGLHYFASRHGFHAPGSGIDERDGVLTWPEGNGFLSRRLAEPHGERLHNGQVALRVTADKHGATVDAWNASTARVERWQADQVVLAVPVFIAARLVESPPPALVDAARMLRHAPWLVANLQLSQALEDRPGAALAWDNVRYGGPSLGYVDAMHQSLQPVVDATVLTAYWALGGDTPGALVESRRRLLAEPWSRWADEVVADLAVAHPDLPSKVVRVDLMRYGHAMSIPVPGVRGNAALRALAEPQARIQFGHADLSGYSVFEEALYQGMRAGRAAATRLA